MSDFFADGRPLPTEPPPERDAEAEKQRLPDKAESLAAARRLINAVAPTPPLPKGAEENEAFAEGLRQADEQRAIINERAAEALAPLLVGKALKLAEKLGADQGEVEPHQNFRLLHIGEVVGDIRPPEYLIDGVIETETLGELFGDPGSCKTFVALSMLLCVASGRSWYGHAVKQGPVVYIVGEGRQGIARRLLAWGKYHGMDVSTLPFFISSMPAALTDPASAAEVAATIAEVTEQHGAPVAIAIDTLARNFGPGDENSTKDMGAFISNLDRYLGNSCVRMVVHHSGHGDKTRSRGNSALKGALDFEFNLSKKTGGKKDDITVEMWCTKMKDLPEWQRPKVFEPRTVTLNDDLLDPIQSVVLEEVDRVIEETSVAGSAKMQAAVDLLQELYSSHRGDLEASGNDPNDAKVTKGEWRDACVDRGLYKRPSTYTMMTAAAERGLIEMDDAYVFLKVSEV
jgi:hypothetical protein